MSSCISYKIEYRPTQPIQIAKMLLVKLHYTTRQYTNILYKSKTRFSQPAITCSKFTIETVEQGVKYVQSYQ